MWSGIENGFSELDNKAVKRVMRGVCVELPLVSVVIPTYKRPDMIERAIDSVLNQTYKRIEVIVVDDNDPGTSSRVKTELVMRKYKGMIK